MTGDPRRLRRLRSTPALRRLVSETRLSPDRFVLPLFVADGLAEEEPLTSLPGHYRWPAERVGVVAKEAEALGIPGVLIFGIPAVKDERGSAAYAADGPAQRAIRE
ncbi:MAG TPA: porphobilinogen synthase, partial [Actinomycetota bacterium]|nr:porphobilinogen synthase [Actinomycetota bacterium]